MGKARRSKGTQRQQRRAFATDSLPGTDADAVEDDNTEVSLNHLNASLFGTTNQEPGKGSGGSRLKVVDDLQSPDSNKRGAALTSLAGIFGDQSDQTTLENSANRFLQANGVKYLILRISDTNVLNRKEAIGALRNLALVDETKYCDVLIREDAVSPLLALLSEVLQHGCTPETTQQECAMEAIRLLNLLVDNCERSLIYINRGDLFMQMIGAAQMDTHWLWSQNAFLEAWSQLLYSIAEENPSTENALLENPTLGHSLIRITIYIARKMSESSDKTDYVHLCRCVLNLLNTMSSGGVLGDNFMNNMQCEEFIKTVKPCIEVPCNIDPISLLLQLREAIQQETLFRQRSGGQSSDNESIEDCANKTKELRKDLDKQLKLVSAALETLCNISIPKDETSLTPIRMMEKYQFLHIVGGLLQRILNGLSSLDATTAYQGIRFVKSAWERSFDCLNNMVQNFNLADQPTVQQLWDMCMTSLKLSMQTSVQEEAANVMDQCTVFAGTLFDCARENEVNVSVADTHIDIIFQLSDLLLKSTNPGKFEEALSVLPHLLGGLVKVKNEATMATRVSNELDRYYNFSSLKVAAEVCDALFDIFGDDSYNDVYYSSNWQAKCQHMGTVLTQAINNSNGDDPEAMERFEDVCNNLSRFLEYKNGS